MMQPKILSLPKWPLPLLHVVLKVVLPGMGARMENIYVSLNLVL